MVEGPDTLVLDEWAGAGEGVTVGAAVPSSVGGWADGYDVVGGSAAAAVEPNNDTLPVVTMSDTVGWLVLGEVPGNL